VLREVTDWLAVLHVGHLVTQGETAEVQRHPAVRELYLGSESAPGEPADATPPTPPAPREGGP
jgi:ABC-type methionine transport system ATPase subunit